MNTLESNVYNPLLDNPITGGDVSNARKDTKKGGYDFDIALGIKPHNIDVT